MKVTRPSGVTPQRARRADKSEAGDFSVKPTSAPATSAPASSSAPIASVDALIALQEDGGGGAGNARKKAVIKGRELLRILDEIRLGLLAGAIPKNHLSALAQAVSAQRDGVDDPILSSVLDDIELRARVELAKFERAKAQIA